MRQAPLVSVAMPCYNSADTIGLALASLRVQTCSAWECIVVDDGSSDNPHAVVEQIGDPRIRYIRLSQNFGRSVARQTAIEASTGKYLTKLDADDWIYPTKLASQVAFLDREATAAVVSSPVILVDGQEQILGIRGRVSTQSVLRGPLERLSLLAIALAPAMLRAETATAVQYDIRLQRSEDADHMLQVLWQHGYGILPDPSYVYRMFHEARKHSLLAGYRSRIRMLWKYRADYPVDAWREMALAASKWVALTLFFDETRLARTLGRRSQSPTEEDRSAFIEARIAIEQEMVHLFGKPSLNKHAGLERSSSRAKGDGRARHRS